MAENEHRIISRIMTDGDVKPLLDRGIDGSWFLIGEHRTALDWLLKHHREYGVLPTKATFHSHMGTTYKILGVAESLEYLLDAQAEMCRGLSMQAGCADIADALEANLVDEAVELAERAVERAHRYNGHGHVPASVVTELERLRPQEIARRQVRAELDEAEWAQMNPQQNGMAPTIEEFVKTPPAPSIIEGVLAAEFNYLCGPDASGKSLLARDWALHVATRTPWRGHMVPRPRNVLWIASEGTHDTGYRWMTQPLWEDAKQYVRFQSTPVNLTSPRHVDRLLKTYESFRPGLVVFDVVYGMGMRDDNGMEDALPVITSMKRVSKTWEAATLALLHPPHEGKKLRRPRGASAWKQLTYAGMFMDGDILEVSKSKVGPVWSEPYQLRYPRIEWDCAPVATDDEARDALIAEDIADHSADSVRARAKRLAPMLGVSVDRARKLVDKYTKAH